MSLAIKAARGAIWNIGVGIGTRFVGVIATIFLAHLLSPEVIGEFLVGAALVMTAGPLSHVGFGQYVIAKKTDREATFHVTLYTVLTLALVLGALWIFRRPAAEAFGAPAAADYLPELIVGVFLQRTGNAISRILLRDLRFTAVAVGRGVGELAFPVVAVGLAYAGWGGESLVVAFVVRGAVQALFYFVACDHREWLVRCRLSWALTVDIFRFGIPLWIAQVAHFASRQWDNLLVSRFFGPHQLGIYNYAYNLADVPATQVGEHIGDILLPSFGQLEGSRRRWALTRATSLMALLVFPLAVGLGAVSETLVAVIFNEEWQGVAPVLLILAVLSVVRPVGWTINSYLVALHRVREVMWLELLKLVALMAFIVVIRPYGFHSVCLGVGLAFGANAVASVLLVKRADGVEIGTLLVGMLGPLLACGPMAAAVYGARLGIAELGGSAIVSLCVEIAVGGLVYVPAAFVLAPSTARDFLRLVKKSLSRSGDDDVA